jgi:hypothetical protein
LADFVNGSTSEPSRCSSFTPTSIVSRSDIFKPLFMEAYDLYMEKEVGQQDGADCRSIDLLKPTNCHL